MPQEYIRATTIELVHTYNQCKGKKRPYSNVKPEQHISSVKVTSVSSPENSQSEGTMANNKNSSSSGGEGDYQLVQHEVAIHIFNFISK